jgi:hypothetical protein
MRTAFRNSSLDSGIPDKTADRRAVSSGGISTEFKLTPHCTRQGQRRVLIEGTVARRQMGTMDSFGLGSLVGSMLSGISLACCFYGYTPDQQTQFFKDVAQNRGVRIEFFSERDAALRWLGVGSGQPV